MVAYANDVQLKTNPAGPIVASLSTLAGEHLLFVLIRCSAHLVLLLPKSPRRLLLAFTAW